MHMPACKFELSKKSNRRICVGLMDDFLIYRNKTHEIGLETTVCLYTPEKEVANPFAVKSPLEQEAGQGTVMIGLKLQHLQKQHSN